VRRPQWLSNGALSNGARLFAALRTELQSIERRRARTPKATQEPETKFRVCDGAGITGHSLNARLSGDR
jgi:hypothetical protein